MTAVTPVIASFADVPLDGGPTGAPASQATVDGTTISTSEPV